MKIKITNSQTSLAFCMHGFWQPMKLALTGGVILIVMCLCACEQKAEKPQDTIDQKVQNFESIEKRIEKAYEHLSNVLEETEDAYEVYEAEVIKILESSSEEEIQYVAKNVDLEIEQISFRIWARSDPKGALKAAREIEDANADEIKLAGTGLDGGPGEAESDRVFKMYLGVFDGWAEVDAKTAWEFFQNRKGVLSNSLVIDDYLDSYYRVIFEHLAKVDPDLVFKMLINYHSGDHDEFYVAPMLGGYLRGAPRGRDWRKELDRLLERKWEKDGWLHAEIRTALMGRWLQDDAEIAEKWFHETDIEGVNWLYHDRDKSAKNPIGLGSAAGYWAARDFPAAWEWMKSYKGLKRKGFGSAVLHGADVFLLRTDSYFSGGSGARAFLIE